MAAAVDFLTMMPLVQEAPNREVTLLFDTQADVFYVNLAGSVEADDSELRDDDVIVRYKNDEVIGYTIMHASKRLPAARQVKNRRIA